jgi:hypothetical protein
MLHLLVTANVHSSLILFTLVMKVTHSTEMSGLTRVALCHIIKDGILQRYCSFAATAGWHVEQYMLWIRHKVYRPYSLSLLEMCNCDLLGHSWYSYLLSMCCHYIWMTLVDPLPEVVGIAASDQEKYLVFMWTLAVSPNVVTLLCVPGGIVISLPDSQIIHSRVYVSYMHHRLCKWF